jgi:lysozyme family protein
MARDFAKCLYFTLSWEGGWSDNPEDPGGCTMQGVTLATYRAYRDDETLTCEDLRGITDAEIRAIYHDGYWRPVWGYRLPVGLDLEVFDWGVTSGPSRAVKVLQELAGSAQDGIMGPDTLAATSEWVEKTGIADAIVAYANARQRYYESLPTWPEFGKGWTNRNQACMDQALQMASRMPPAYPVGLEERVARLEAWARSFAETDA